MGVKVKLPFAFKFSVPCVGELTSTAVIASPSTSLSFARTPAAGTLSVAFFAREYDSATATGAVLELLMVSVTVATVESAAPSLAR